MLAMLTTLVQRVKSLKPAAITPYAMLGLSAQQHTPCRNISCTAHQLDVERFQPTPSCPLCNYRTGMTCALQAPLLFQVPQSNNIVGLTQV